MSQLPLAAYNNQQLFSDYYLNTLLPKRDDWILLAQEAKPIMQQIKDLYTNVLIRSNEAQLEKDWVQPILTLLGHTYEIQASLKTPDGTKKPDYVLFQDEKTVHNWRGKILTDTILRPNAIAIGDAKAWGRSLDQTLKAGSDPFSNKNPSYQISFYIQHSGVDWGILTNGQVWRLYHRDTAHKLDRFYEVNLESLVQDNDTNAFLYFYTFFRRHAFNDHALSLNSILHASQEYAYGVSESLKEQVYTALRHLAQGFLDYRPNKLYPDEKTLKAIYDNSLIVLYRFLFILYAEARDLLPIRESQLYFNTYSLDSIKRKIAKNIDLGRDLLSTSLTIWPSLRALFNIINEGSTPLKVATFNGGLFDPNRHVFLEQHGVGDARLQHAIDLLARIQQQFVDYRDLAERHLGSIYEGLLEFKLEPDNSDDEEWTIKLIKSKQARRDSESYYTPDYIVKYMVTQLLEPVLAPIKNLPTDAEKLKAVLDINILDPSMGSGHFLVEATEQLAQFLVDVGIPTGIDTHGEAEVRYWKRRIVQTCIYGVDLNPLAVDLAKLSLWLLTVAKDRPLSFLDHHLRTGNALIGFWIRALGKSGSSTHPKRAVSKYQLSLIDNASFQDNMLSAVALMTQIEDESGDTISAVKVQEELYEQMRMSLRSKYGRVADLMVSRSFGVNIDQSLWTHLVDYAMGRAISTLPALLNQLDRAENISLEQHFFHWELEFPEVFFDSSGKPKGDQAGFDIVIGNPPYDILKRSSDIQQTQIIDFLRQELEYKDVLSSMLNIFHLMIVRGLTLLKKNRLFSFIVPMSLLSDISASGTRKFLFEKSFFLNVQAFPQKDDINDRVFKDAKLSTLIFITRKGSETKEFICRVHPGKNISEDSPDIHVQMDRIRRFDPENLSIPLGNPDESHILSSFYEDPLFGSFRDITNVLVGEIDMTQDRSYVQSTITPYELLKGAHLQRYFQRVNPKQGKREWVDVNKIYARDGINSIKLLNLDKQRIAFQAITGTDDNRRLKGTLIPQGFFLANSVNYLVPKNPKISIFFLLAVLNSQLSEWRFRLTSTNNNVNNYEILALPMRIIQFTTSLLERSDIKSKAVTLYESKENKLFLDFIEQRSDMGDKSDVIHDILEYLAQNMIDLNKQRQELVDDFMLDLDGILLPGQEMINRMWTPIREPQNDIRNYATAYARYQSKVYDAQKNLGPLFSKQLNLQSDIGKITEDQWKWIIKKAWTSVTNLADIVRVYRKRQPQIADIDQQIIRCDKMIDRIIYMFYKLTEEDIVTIEAHSLKR